MASYVNGNGGGLRPEDAAITNGSAASLLSPSGGRSPGPTADQAEGAEMAHEEGVEEDGAPPPIPEKDGERTRPSTPLPETDPVIVEEPEEMEEQAERDAEAEAEAEANAVGKGMASEGAAEVEEAHLKEEGQGTSET